MKTQILRPLYLIIGLSFILSGVPAYTATTMTAVVNASDLPRGLLKASVEYPVGGSQYDLYFPQWVEGAHGPNGPIQNLAEFSVYTLEGERIEWQRDPHNACHFLVQPPRGAKRIRVETTYICNQATANTLGVDSHGTSGLGIISWNTCLLYPGGYDIGDVRVDLTLLLPNSWQWASSLRERSRQENTVCFEPVSYRQLVDSPLIAGKEFRTIDITPVGGTPHYLHLTSESKQAIHPDEKTIEKLKKMVAEAMALFGTEHNYDYHFLLILSDALPFLGLEHLRSSLNVVGERGLDEDQLHTTGHLITHEYGHRWCGKYHRPADMVSPDHHHPTDMRLLWVYEGLDQYLGVVLTARAGLFATKEYSSLEGALRDGWVGVGKTLVGLMRQKGRRSINLEDTASSTYLRRRWGKFWTALNRPQDYYFEGALLWYEIDAILREESDSKITLDDFVRRFLGRYDAGKDIMGFEESDVIAILNSIHPYDWQSLIDDRVRGLHDEIPLQVLDRMGYRIEYSNRPTPYDDDPTLTAVGMQVDANGSIQRIIPHSLADQARLAEGMTIIGVNNRKFGSNRLRDAVADSTTSRTIEFLLLNGDEFQTVVVPYDGGLKYVDIVRNENKPDRFAEIFAEKVQ